MALVGAILMNGVASYFADDFISQMDACFSPGAELYEYLRKLQSNE